MNMNQNWPENLHVLMSTKLNQQFKKRGRHAIFEKGDPSQVPSLPRPKSNTGALNPMQFTGYTALHR